MSRFRNWCFTLNNYTEEEYNSIVNADCKYLVVGKEVGESGTPHLQGYIEFQNPRVLSGVKKVLGNKVHLEPRRGTSKQASDYCKKDGDFVELGVMSCQGERNDLNEVKELILAGTDRKEIIIDNFKLYCKYRNGIETLFDLVASEKIRTTMTKGIWIYGPTGTGKSHKAFELAGADRYIWRDDNGYWNGYRGQKTVIINDFRGSIKYGELLNLVDMYEHYVKIKGRDAMSFTSELVIVTSSLPPEKVYYNLDASDSIDQLRRRFEVIYMDKKFGTEAGTEVLRGNTTPAVVLNRKLEEKLEILETTELLNQYS